MSERAAAVRQVWVATVVGVGGDRAAAQESAAALIAAYAQPDRHYHGIAHIHGVLAAVGDLFAASDVTGRPAAAAVLAACAHDVVQSGNAGRDEQESARWAGEALLRAGVAADVVVRVRQLVLATADHVAPPGDVAAQVLLDADLAILGSAPHAYDAYVAGVRAEYQHVAEAQWRQGRAAVLRRLLDREPLYATVAARERWEAAARGNLERELAALTAPE